MKSIKLLSSIFWNELRCNNSNHFYFKVHITTSILILIAINFLSAQTVVNLADQCNCEVITPGMDIAPGAISPAGDEVGDLLVDSTGEILYWDGDSWETTTAGEVIPNEWNNPDGTPATQASTDINYVAGDVGIGTSTPDSKLHVSGNIQASQGQNENSILLRPSITLPNIRVGGTNPTSAQNLAFQFGADVEFMRITGASGAGQGKLGIGITNPAYKLHVRGGYIGAESAGGEGAIVLRPGSVNGSLDIPNIRIGGTNTTSAQNLAFRFGANVEFMRMTNVAGAGQGRLGILTTTPTSTLDLNGNFRIRNLPTGTNTDLIVTTDANGNIRKISATDVVASGGGSGGADGDAWGVNGEDQTTAIGRTGNVGIGTTSPMQTLDVNGSIRVSGNIIDGNNDLRLYPEVTGPALQMINQTTSFSSNNFSDFRFNDGYTELNTRGGNRLIFNTMNGGNVGIGINNPTAKLMVKGNALTWTDAAEQGTISLSTPGGNTGIIFNVNGLNNRTRFNMRNVANANAADRYFSLGYALGDFTIRNSSGNVGIGTTTPSVKLDVIGDAIRWTSGNHEVGIETPGGHTGIIFNRNALGNRTRFNMLNVANANATDRYFSFGYTSGDLTIRNSSGNVGIGTTTPDAKLDVAGTMEYTMPNGVVTDVINEANLNSGTNGVRHFSPNGSIALQSNITSGNYALRFGTLSRNYAMTIQSNTGNIGVNTDSPTTTLDVNGQILSRNGGGNGSYTSRGIQFGYQGSANYRHAIGSRHNGGADANNALDFYLWNQGTDAVSAVPTKRVMTLDGNGNNGNVQILGNARVFGGTRLNLGNGTSSDFVVTADAGGGIRRRTAAQIVAAGGGGADGDAWGVTGENQSGSIVRNGKVGIGPVSTSSRLDIADASRSGTHATNQSLYVTGSMSSGAAGTANGNIEFRHSNGTQGIGFGYNTIYAAGSGTNQTLRINSKGNSNLILNDPSYSSGNVGIRNTSPLQALDVNGSIRVSGNIIDGNNDLRLYPESNGPALQIIDQTTSFNSNDFVDFRFHNDYTQLSTRSSESLIFNGSAGGNVGIGTTNPTTKLTVKGNALTWTDDLERGTISFSSPAGKTGIVFNYLSANNYSRFNIINYDNATQANRFVNFSFTSEPGLSIRKGGNVGIGTVIPTAKLEVNGDLKVRKVTNGSTLSGTNDLGLYSQTSGSWMRYVTNGGNHVFYTGGGIGAAERMRLTSSGNLGIGTTNPNHKLQVVTNSSNDLITDATTALSIENSGGGTVLQTLGSSNKELRIGLNPKWNSNAGAFFISSNSTSVMEFDYSSKHLYIMPTNAQSGANVGIGATASNPPTSKLTVVGSASKVGGGSWGTFSDRRIKKNIQPYTDGLEQVLQITPKSFEYNGKGGYEADGKTYYGVIAQEMKTIAPYMVTEMATNDFEDQLSYDATALTYMLVNAVQEQQAQIKEQQVQIEKLEKDYTTLKAVNTELTAKLSELEILKAELKNIKMIISKGDSKDSTSEIK